MMKELFITYSMKKIRKQYSDYDNNRLDKIQYGLEGLYILITKTIIIFSIAFIVGIIKELLLLVVFFNSLRLTGFGLHAKSSGGCLGSSTIVFIGLAFLSKFLVVSFPIRLVIALLCTANFILYAPADTEKRPLVNKRKRRIYKAITATISIIYTALIIFIKTNFISNIILFAMIIEGVLINPLSYKLLGLKYDNYKNYK